MLQVIQVPNFPLINPGDDIAQLILNSLKDASIDLDDNDIFVIAQSIISKAENRIIDLQSITPSYDALNYAKIIDKNPKFIELILKESNKILKYSSKAIIVENKLGFVCANAGIDQSNSGNVDHVTLLPLDPDESARQIQKKIEEKTGKKIAIIISDTQGRPFRNGAINVGIGIAGFKDPIQNYKGQKDLFGYILQTTEVNIIDELASAAELIMGESNEGFPVILIKGYKFPRGTSTSKTLIRNKKEDLFRDD
ncbi:MAG: coenzyme F420-0:L-glutamate ligase [Candidatus Lokiarchaeota archaeon]|nr:coenzyme F420-0:L-glutamate ligase [Candidatus Lokiarchaeota archaeon]